ncbi:MAG TPA: PKD domain-containing protein [Solirubrobacteraceae bacterium]
MLVIGLALLLGAAPAFADSTSEYGEVVRFGGFDSSAFNSEHYGGPLTPGKFLDPTGFAVDPQDNTVYVVDRTSYYAENPTRWRIQQLSPAGAVLGTSTFTLPNSNFGASAVMGLAVDHRAGRLYALVVGSPPPSSVVKTQPVAQELLAWSTTPASGGELTAAPGLASDPLHTTGGLVSDKTQLLAGPTPLYSPQGIAIDRLETSGVDNPVVIEASDLLPGAGLGNPIPGDTVVQQVATDGVNTGDLLASWSGASVKQQLSGSWGPLGISTNPDGTLTVVLDAERLSATDAYVVRLQPDLSEPQVLNGDAIEPSSIDFDQATVWIDESPFASLAGIGVSDPYGAGSEVVRLSTAASNSASGPYAGDFFSQQATESGQHTDYQFSPEQPGVEYWYSGAPEANIGIRLLAPLTDGAISTPTGGTIVNTLGSGIAGEPCRITASEAALAAGADGTLWILDRGPKADRPKVGGVGRQIIEFAPGTGQLCRQPSGTFTMTPTGGASHPGEETLTIPAGTEVKFDAGSLIETSIKPTITFAKPFAYEWDLDGNPANGPARDGFETDRQMQPPSYYWPTSSATYKYTRPGRYTVRARLRSDYGVYTTPPATVVVTSPARPHAQFTVTAAPGDQEVTFNAAGSTPGVGSIANYHWSWGDGSSEDEGPEGPIVTHTYAQPGAYDVTLKVTNSSFQSAVSTPQAVTVEAVKPPPAVESVSLTGPLYAIAQALYPIPPAPDKNPTNLSPRLHFTGHAVNIGLSCPPSKERCVGTVRLETATAFSAGRSGGKPRRRRTRLLLGQVSFALSAGQQKTVAVRLSARGMALLKQRKRLSVLITIAAHDSLGNPGVSTLHLTLKAPAGRPSKRHP